MTVIETVAAWAEMVGVEAEVVAGSHVVVTLPGGKKLKTNVSVKVGRYGVDCQAFIIRHPDENAEQFMGYLLRKNLGLKLTSFGVDHLGDVYLRASVPVEACDEAMIDRLMGEFVSVADGSFNELLVLGFLTSMKKEWAWRVSRGESTRNLEAFRKLLEPGAANP